jgi:multiple sugar transport system ATP-binding protein
MSLVHVEVSDTVSLRGEDGWSLALWPQNAPTARVASDRKAILGARHSSSSLSKSAAPGSLPGKVYIVEPTGDITFAQVKLGTAIVTISVPPTVALAADETVWLGFDRQRLHLFDGVTQQALNN